MELSVTADEVKASFDERFQSSRVDEDSSILLTF